MQPRRWSIYCDIYAYLSQRSFMNITLADRRSQEADFFKHLSGIFAHLSVRPIARYLMWQYNGTDTIKRSEVHHPKEV